MNNEYNSRLRVIISLNDLRRIVFLQQRETLLTIQKEEIFQREVLQNRLTKVQLRPS